MSTNRMHGRAGRLAAATLLLTALPGAAESRLPPAHDLWLNREVKYIATPRERKVFLQLKNDSEREAFIAAFWRQRDPTPGTEENEFRSEHYKRLEHADRVYGRGTSTPGWQTDRGRIYIVLGEPNSIQNYSGFSEVYPCEIWSYQGMERFGLPPAFNLLFYDKRNRGEYVIYSPLGDGPQNLIIGFDGKPEDFEDMYTILNKYNTPLAVNAFSLIPGEGMAEGRPTMASDALLQSITLLPRQSVKDLYAERFLQYKESVTLDYSANYLESRSQVQQLFTPSGRALVYTLIQIDRLSVNLYEGVYSTVLKLNGRITTPEGREVHQFARTYDLRFDEEQVRRINDSAFTLLDAFPLIPGNYHLQLLLKNETSKEFTSLEKDLVIPGSFRQIFLTAPLLGYELKRDAAPPAALTPFHVGTGQLLVAADSLFTRQDTLWLFSQLLGGEESQKERLTLHVSISRQGATAASFEQSRPLNELLTGAGSILLPISLKDLAPAYYRLRVALLDPGGKEILSAERDFILSPVSQVNRPQVYFKAQRAPGDSLVDFILGSQHFALGDLSRSRPLLEAAYRSAPGMPPYALGLARLLLQQKEYRQLAAVLAPLTDAAKPDYEALRLLGQSHLDRQEWRPALAVLQKIIVHFGEIADVWNDVGRCHLQLGEPEEACRALEKSLAKNPDQPRIRELLERAKAGK